MLIETATKLFLTRGYGVVGTTEICRVAHVNKGTFYHFFNSKASLAEAAINAYADRFENDFKAIAPSTNLGATMDAIFDVPARANREWCERYGSAPGCLVGNLAVELGAVEPLVQNVARAALVRWQAALAPLVALHVDESDDVATGTARLIALLQGGLLLAKTFDDLKQIDVACAGAKKMFRAEPSTSQV